MDISLGVGVAGDRVADDDVGVFVVGAAVDRGEVHGLEDAVLPARDAGGRGLDEDFRQVEFEIISVAVGDLRGV